MKKRLRMKKTLLGVLILLTIFSISHVSAWGISGSYTRDKPLTLTPGSTQIVVFNLQNLVDNEDLRIRASVVNGTEYAEIIGPTEYDLPFGASGVKVSVRVNAPAAEGDYLIGIAFTTITGGLGQGVVMGEEIVRNFYLVSSSGAPPVITEEEIESKFGWWFYAILIVIAIAVIILMRLKPKKKEEKVVKVAKKKR